MTVRNRFSPRVAVVLEAKGGRTKQSMRDECDINNILRKYVKTGTIAHGNRFRGSYGEFPSMDFRDALHKIMEAEAMFQELPAMVRRRFQNDPANFLEFVQDSSNEEEMRKLGLLKPKAEDPAPMRVEVVNPPAAEGTVST